VNPHPPNPHELAPLLLDLGRAGIELAPHPTDPVRLRHRPAHLPPDLSARLRIHRAAVLWLLLVGYAPEPHGHPPTDAGYTLCERLGIADGLGIPTHPGSPAWLVAVGESIGDSCQAATQKVHSGHGSTDESHSGGGEGEQPNALRDRKGRGRGP